MANCECLAGCLFFNDKMANMPVTAQITKERYCLQDNSHCARYMVFKTLGRERVPADLFPNEVYLAERLVAGRT